MIFILSALASSFLYSTDSVLAKIALDEMPFTVFMFIVSCMYIIIAISIYVVNRKDIHIYFTDILHHKYILIAIISIIIGTIIADALMWYALMKSTKQNIPLTTALIHTSPIFAAILVFFVFKKTINIYAFIGIIITVIGIIITVINS